MSRPDSLPDAGTPLYDHLADHQLDHVDEPLHSPCATPADPAEHAAPAGEPRGWFEPANALPVLADEPPAGCCAHPGDADEPAQAGTA